MIEQTINEWLSDFRRLSPEEYHSNTAVPVQNNNIISALYSYLEDVNKYQKVICFVSVCDVLFKYYRSSEPELKQFTLQFLPQILYTYLNAVAYSDKKTSRIVETLVIGIYNLEIVDDNGQAKVLSFRLPSLAQSSIYHEPVSLAPASLTESALKRLEQRDSQLVRWGPLQPVEKLIAQNRLSILSELLFCYNRQIATLPKSSLEKLCKISSKIMTQGFSKTLNTADSYRRSSIPIGNENIPSVVPRITVSSKFLCQLLYSLYFAMFNGVKYEASQAMDAIAFRASYQGLNDVILLTNAIKNCIYLLNTDQSENPTMGITVSVADTSISTATTTLSKSMITNASFRTKKLPDDIPIQDPHQPEGSDSLGAISEEKEESTSTPEIHPRRSLPRMAANFGKKTKEKIAIAVKSGSVTSMKSITKSNSLLVNGGDASETDESGIELGGSDISNLATGEGENTSTPYNNRKTQSINNTLDIDLSRSMQVSSV